MRHIACLALLALPACADLGERADGGECPAGESCSPLTPNGLEFEGPYFSDQRLFADPGVKVTATGGTQTVSAFDHSDGLPLAVPYLASFVGGPLEVVDTSGNQVDVSASAGGSGRLELRDQGQRLLDRITLSSADLTSISIGPSAASELVRVPEIALWNGSTDVRLTVALFGDAGRLVDESMVIGGDVDRFGWDEISVPVVEGDLALDVTAGDRPAAPITVPAVSQLTAAQAQLEASSNQVGDAQVVCVFGLAGTAEVIGVPWQITIDGPASVPDEPGLASLFGSNCIDLTLDEVGTVTVTASAPGASTSLEFAITPASQKPRTFARPADLAATLGDRAAN